MSQSPRCHERQMKNQILVTMKVKNQALTVRRRSDKTYDVVTSHKKQNVEIIFQKNPDRDSHPFYVSLVFQHKTVKYFLYCKGTKVHPQLKLKAEGKCGNSHKPRVEKRFLFKMTMDSEKYKFQPYLKDDWYLSVTGNTLKLNPSVNENALFALEPFALK